jgi:hypothetical protein
VVAGVLALHLLLLWSWREATRRPAAPVPELASAMSLRWVAEARIVPSAASRQADASPAAATARPRRLHGAKARRAPAPQEDAQPAPAAQPEGITQEQPHEAELANPAVTAASSPLLDSAASRRAIRELARQRPLTEQAALASDTSTSRPAPGARLGERIREAGKGDCAKGEYFGAGMGLLSLPFLVAAKVRDDCAQ